MDTKKDQDQRLKELMYQYHQRMVAVIKKHGYAIQAVTDDDPKGRFFYTIGLSMKEPQWPEILVTGNLDPRTAADMINGTVAQWRKKEQATLGPVDLSTTFHDDNRFQVASANKVECDKLMLAIRTYSGGFDYTPVQLLWSTNKGILPTEPGYPKDSYEHIQPLYLLEPV